LFFRVYLADFFLLHHLSRIIHPLLPYVSYFSWNRLVLFARFLLISVSPLNSPGGTYSYASKPQAMRSSSATSTTTTTNKRALFREEEKERSANIMFDK
jgi:hypothetical protein